MTTFHNRRRYGSPMRSTTGREVCIPEPLETQRVDTWAKGEVRILLALLAAGLVVIWLTGCGPLVEPAARAPIDRPQVAPGLKCTQTAATAVTCVKEL